MKKSLFLTCFVMLCSLVFGQNRWTVNDALYENSMSLLAKVTVGNETAANAEIAAFYDDEVRGVGKTDVNGKVFLTIFGSDREQITFKIYDGEKVYASKYTVEFETNAANTSPVTVDFYEIHWNYEPNYDLHASMTIVGKIHIDGVPQTGDNFELAVFYNDSLRSVARPNNGIVYLYIPGHGHEVEPFEFKLYDGTRELVSDLRDLNVTFVNNKYDGTLDAPKPLNFITAPYVAQIGEVRYQSFANAFNAALENNATITLLENFAIDSETYTVADGKNVTLNMNGKKITVKDNKTSNYELFYIYGGMTVEGEGTIELTSANNRGWNAMSAIFHNRGGVLTIKNGTYKNLGGTDMAWVVDNSGNYYGDATTNINGGTLTSTYTAIRNRMEQNTHGASGKAILNVDGGTIEGTTSAIWAQAASESTTAPATGEINITGGKVGLINTARSAGAVSMTTVAGGTVAAFKGEAGELKVQGGTITGTVTIMTAEGVEVPYAITSEGLYVAAVAEVNGNYYATLQEAVNVGGTVKVLQDIVLTETVTVAAGKEVVLDLNGKTVTTAFVEGSTTNHLYAFTNNGTLTIKGEGTINARGIFNYGTMTLTNGTINAIDGNGGYAVRNYAGATFTMNGGTIATVYEDGDKPGNGYDASPVRVDEGATFTMNDGEIDNVSNYTVAIDNYGTTIINGGKATTVHTTLANSGTMTINGGTFTCNGIDGITAHALWAAKGTTTINGGTFNGKDNYNGFNVDAEEGANVVITGGEFLPVHSGSLYGKGTIKVSGGTFFDVVATNRCSEGYAPVKNDNGTYTVKPVVAKIGDLGYEKLEDAIAAAQAGEEITLLTDIEASEVILIGKSVTINGNGHKVTSSASHVFRVTTSNTEVTLNDVNMVSTAVRVGTNDVRGISIDIVDNVKLTLNNSSVDFTDASANDWAYAVNVTGGNNHAVTINGGTYEGANVINVRGANNTIVVENTTLNCTYPNNDMYAGACIWVLQNQNSSVEATGNTFNGNNAIAFNLGTGTALTESNNTDNTKVAVAKIGDVYYTSVNDAINAAENGATVQLLKRTIDEAIAPWAGDSQHRLEKSITIVGYTDFGTTLTGGLFLGYNDGTVRDNTITVKGINFVGKGVTVANQKNVVIEGNKFTGIDALVSEKHGNSGSAILVIGSENNKSIVATVKNNVIENVTLASQAGIYMSQVANATVEGNTVTGTTHNAITISAATDATINVTNNTLEHWGKGGEGRAMRISGGTTVNVNGNVMSNTAAPEEFVKITGATTIDASKNYWNGVSPLSMFNTDLAKDPVEILVDYYTDVEKKNRVVLEKSVAKIGTKYYQSFASAIAAVKNGETIKLLTDCDEEVTIKQVVNKNFIINGNGKTYTGTINVNGNNKGAGLTGAGLTITNVNFVLNGQWQSGIFANKGTYACNIIVDKCSFTGNNAKEAYGIRLRSGYNITVKNITGKNLYDLVYAQENVKGFTAENVNVTDSNIGFWFPYGNNLNFINVNLDVTGTGVGIINRNAGEATFEKCTIIAKNAVTLSQDNNNAIAYTLKFNGENEFTTSEEWLTVTGTNAVLKAVLNDAELDVTETSGLVANIGNVYYNTLQHAINAAQDGNTVAIANDFTLDSKKYETQNDDYATLVNVKDKAVTIDLNGKTMTVNPTAADFTNAKGAMLLGIFSADTDGHLTLVDSSDDAKGTVNVNVNDAKVYSFGVSESLYADKSNSGELTIKSGNYNVIGTLANAMFFSDADEVITINGGKFHLDNASTIANYPWFVNTLGNNELQVIVNGGTFNVDINHQYRPFEIKIAETLAVKNNGDGTWTIVPAEAFVTEMLGSTVNEAGGNEHKVGYATLKEAVEAVNNLGNDVTLLKNVEMEEILVLDKAVNLNGAGYTLSSKAERAINVATEGEVNISNLTIATTNNTERAINVIQKAANLTLTDVKAEGFKYTINVASSSVGSTITTNGGKFSGYAAVNITGSKTSFTSTNTEFIGINNASLHESNNYGVIVVNAAPTENVNVNINGGKVVAQTTVNRQFIVDAENAKDANITINAELVLANGDVLNATIENGLVVKVKAEYADELLAQGYVSSAADANGLVTVLGVKVAQVEDTYYATLQDAIDAADGKTVVVLTDIDLTEGVTVAAGKVVTLDLNDNTVTGTPTEAKAYAVITNNGNLTIKNGSIICDHKLAGSTGYAVNAITNGGTLTIDGATVENKSTAQYQIGYAIDNNSTTGNAVVVVKSGAVRASGSYYYDGIRQFCNSLTNENDVTIEGGEVSTLWMQNPSDGAEKNTKDVKGSFSITGGKVGVVSTEPSANFTASITAGEITKVEHFQTAVDRDLVGYITGGTFGMDVTDPFCHEDYSAIPQANNTWVVEQTAGTLTRHLINGWSWFSSYIDIEGSYGFGLLTDALGASAEQIKEGKNGQGSFAQYSQTSGWYGNLNTTSSKKMYQIKTIEEVTINIHGDFFGVENYKPILQQGWNYISYPHTEKLETALALQGFNPVSGDIIKTLNSSMTYLEGLGWLVGDLINLEPGVGYMYRSNAGTKQVSYTTVATRSTAKAYVSESPEHWTVGAAQYPNNMTMIATLDVEGGDYEVAAFVNGELRGSVRPIYVEDLDQYIMVMTILGEEVADVTFKYYDFNTEEEYDLNNVVVYSDNAVLGSVEEPYTLTRGTTGIGEATLSDINIYPNPTTTDREINLQATCDKVEVFNTLGIKVAEYQNVDSIDALETAGTYVIRVTLNGDVKHCRLVVR